MDKTTTDGLTLDLIVDLQGMDETGLPWAFQNEATDPARVVEGGWVIVGTPAVNAVARVIDIQGGIVHVEPLPGPATKWLHLIPRSPQLA